MASILPLLYIPYDKDVNINKIVKLEESSHIGWILVKLWVTLLN